MLARVRTRLTYANVVSTICLFLLLGASAAALDVVPFAKKAGYAKKAGKVDGLSASKKPKKNRLLALNKKAKFPAAVLPDSLAGPPGVPGEKGEQGEKGDAGEPGADGADGTARAFAFVDPTACPSNICATTRNRNVTKVELSPPGIYCITVAGVSSSETVISMAGVDNRKTAAPKGAASAMADATNPSCDPGEFQVTTERADLPANTVSESGTVAFWFAVP